MNFFLLALFVCICVLSLAEIGEGLLPFPKLGNIFRKLKKRQVDGDYLEQCAIVNFTEEHKLETVNVLAFLDASWQYSHQQAAMLKDLKGRFERFGMKDINFFVINSMSSTIVEETEIEVEEKTWMSINISEADFPLEEISLESLIKKLGNDIYLIQDTPEIQIWNKLHVSRDQILVVDGCGKLTYQVIVPWSILHFPYVKAAILSTYNDEPCGPCEGTNLETSIVKDSINDDGFTSTTGYDTSLIDDVTVVSTTEEINSTEELKMPNDEQTTEEVKVTEEVTTTEKVEKAVTEAIVDGTIIPEEKTKETMEGQLKTTVKEIMATEKPMEQVQKVETIKEEMRIMTEELGTTTEQMGIMTTVVTTEKEVNTMEIPTERTIETMEMTTEQLKAKETTTMEQMEATESTSEPLEIMRTTSLETMEEGTTEQQEIIEDETKTTKNVQTMETTMDEMVTMRTTLIDKESMETTTEQMVTTKVTIESTTMEEMETIGATTRKIESIQKTTEQAEIMENITKQTLEDTEAIEITTEEYFETPKSETGSTDSIFYFSTNETENTILNSKKQDDLQKLDDSDKNEEMIDFPLRIIMQAPHLDIYDNSIIKHDSLILNTRNPSNHEHLESGIKIESHKKNFTFNEENVEFLKIVDLLSIENRYLSSQFPVNPETISGRNKNEYNQLQFKPDDNKDDGKINRVIFGKDEGPGIFEILVRDESENFDSVNLQTDYYDYDMIYKKDDTKSENQEESDIFTNYVFEKKDEESKSKLLAHYSKLLPWIYYVLQ